MRNKPTFSHYKTESDIAAYKKAVRFNLNEYGQEFKGNPWNLAEVCLSRLNAGGEGNALLLYVKSLKAET